MMIQTLLLARASRAGREIARQLGLRVITRPTQEPTVNWGMRVALPEGSINRRLPGNKLKELEALAAAGLEVVPFQALPSTLPSSRGISSLSIDGSEWLPRTMNHREGRDFSGTWRTWNGTRRGEHLVSFLSHYATQRLPFSTEARVHVANGRVVAAGLKCPLPGRTAHPWIRSHRLGWGIRYDDLSRAQILRGVRPLAVNAISALGMNFGAVDIAWSNQIPPTILEVNSAPGGWPNTIARLARAIGEMITQHAE